MATGIPFPEANTLLRAPTPEDAAAGTVYDLHVHRYNDLDGQPNVISKWKFSPDELKTVVANGGEFWFHCWGHTHPPIAIMGDSPFVRAKVAEERETVAADELEAVARALCAADSDIRMGDPEHVVQQKVDQAWRGYLHFARAAVAAMEPRSAQPAPVEGLAELMADKARLDYLDRCNAALNAHYGTTYSWKLIQSHNVNRLMLGDSYDVDLNDSQPNGLPSCRDAIDERMRNSGRAAA